MTIPRPYPNWQSISLLIALSLGIAGLFLPGLGFLLNIAFGWPFLLFFLPPYPISLWNQLKNDPFLWVTVIFVILVILSGLYSNDKKYLLQKLELKLPLLLLAPGLLSLRRLHPNHLLWLKYLFLALALGGAIYTTYMMMAQWQTHSANTDYDLKPTPVNHIIFSLLCAIAAAMSLFLAMRSSTSTASRWLWATAFALLFIFLHILSVRSGLLALYGGLVVSIGVFVYNNPKNLKVVAIIAVLAALPVLAYFTIPPLRAKINYMAKDINNYQSGGSVRGYSDGNRLLSWKIAFDATKENMLFGIGYGDVKHGMYHYYVNHQKDVEPRYWLNEPHSQFFMVYMGLGVVGICVFLAMLAGLLFPHRRFLQPMYMFHFVLMAVAFLVEATLETRAGVGLFIIPLMLFFSEWTAASTSKTT